MKWFEAAESVKPHVVQIRTPQGSGSGFLLWRSQKTGLCAVATAAHVIDHSHYWEQPVRIEVAGTKEVALLRHNERAIFTDAARDTAVLLFDPKELALPSKPLRLITKGKILKVGVTIGWLGFPDIPAADLCFFTGAISSWIEDRDAYFVDGVAINGVSGGPAFSAMGEPHIIGVVSAYMPNRATGETLPGLGIVRHVKQFHDVVQEFNSLDEAKAQESPASEPPPPSSPPASTGRGAT